MKLEGQIYFACKNQNIEEVGEILSQLIFQRQAMFSGLTNYLRDEFPFIYTDLVFGFKLSIMQNDTDKELYVLEVNDTIFMQNSGVIDLTYRLKYYINQYSDFKIIED